MRTICIYCGVELEADAYIGIRGEHVSHGVCASCQGADAEELYRRYVARVEREDAAALERLAPIDPRD